MAMMEINNGHEIKRLDVLDKLAQAVIKNAVTNFFYNIRYY